MEPGIHAQALAHASHPATFTGCPTPLTHLLLQVLVLVYVCQEGGHRLVGALVATHVGGALGLPQGSHVLALVEGQQL